MSRQLNFKPLKNSIEGKINEWISYSLAVIAIIGFWYIYSIARPPEDKNFYYAFPGVLFLFALFAFITNKRTNRVSYLELDNNRVKLEFEKNRMKTQVFIPFSELKIELYELKDESGNFSGLRLRFINLTDKKKYDFPKNSWGYENLEKIYLAVKERKNEEIPDKEAKIFEQLQITNNSSRK